MKALVRYPSYLDASNKIIDLPLLQNICPSSPFFSVNNVDSKCKHLTPMRWFHTKCNTDNYLSREGKIICGCTVPGKP